MDRSEQTRKTHQRPKSCVTFRGTSQFVRWSCFHAFETVGEMFPHSAARGKRVGDAPVFFPLKLRLGEAGEPKHDRPASINRRRIVVASELLCPPLFQHRQPDVRLAVEASCYSPDFKHLYGPDRGNGPRFDCYGKRGAASVSARCSSMAKDSMWSSGGER